MNRWGRTAMAFGILVPLTVAAPFTSVAAQYPLHQPVPGGVAVIEIGLTFDEGYEARFGRTPILVLERQGVWFGVIGIGLDTALGNYLISVRTPDNLSSLGFYVKPHSYPFKEDLSQLGAPENMDAPLTWRPDLDASFPLNSPAKGAQIEQFGSRYEAEGAAKSVRWAVLSKIEDKEVVAPGRGVIAEILNIDGINYYVTIDHGMGLYSCVGPIRNIDRESGQEVEKGETLGELGIDSILPHTLYWKVTLNGVAINPVLVSDQLQRQIPQQTD